MKGQKGFSLIELMVVVVIIGFLVGMGLPQYQQYVMKSKRSEAQSLLSGMYTSQKSFFAEWTTYYGDFNAVGFGLDGDQTYAVGFTGAGAAGPLAHPNPVYSGAAPAVINSDVFCQANACRSKVAKHPALATMVAGLPGGTQADQATFTFGAASDLDNDAAFDTWTINENRQLEHLSDDMTQ